jgi:hypothetical protein
VVLLTPSSGTRSGLGIFLFIMATRSLSYLA